MVGRQTPTPPTPPETTALVDRSFIAPITQSQSQLSSIRYDRQAGQVRGRASQHHTAPSHPRVRKWVVRWHRRPPRCAVWDGMSSSQSDSIDHRSTTASIATPLALVLVQASPPTLYAYTIRNDRTPIPIPCIATEMPSRSPSPKRGGGGGADEGAAAAVGGSERRHHHHHDRRHHDGGSDRPRHRERDRDRYVWGGMEGNGNMCVATVARLVGLCVMAASPFTTTNN